MLSLKGDNKEKVGSMGMACGTSMNVALAGTHPEGSEAEFPDAATFLCCLSFRLTVFQG